VREIWILHIEYETSDPPAGRGFIFETKEAAPLKALEFYRGAGINVFPAARGSPRHWPDRRHRPGRGGWPSGSQSQEARHVAEGSFATVLTDWPDVRFPPTNDR
jgi:hypothetical protein